MKREVISEGFKSAVNQSRNNYHFPDWHSQRQSPTVDLTVGFGTTWIG
jgi:hypothetical protein